MVRPRRLELPRVLPHSDLNAARLPIPPRPQRIGRLRGYTGFILSCEEKTYGIFDNCNGNGQISD